jgi:hypothetical protein
VARLDPHPPWLQEVCWHVLVWFGAEYSLVETYPNVLEREVFSRVGGVPVREEAPESSPGRPREPPGPMRLPLLLREENIEVGPRVTFWLEVRLADPFSLLRSSRPTWLLFCC